MTDSRPSWDEIWDAVASQVAARSLCVLAQVGAVITDASNRVVATGYNGPPARFVHADLDCSYWCPRSVSANAPLPVPHRGTSLCSAIHAEANALLSADRSRWASGTMFVNKHPCWECSKLIANSGLSRLAVKPVNPTPDGHHSEQTYAFLEMCGITVEVVE